MTTDDLIHVCASAALEEAGKGVRFPVTAGGEDAGAFVIRYNGVAYGYLNRCAHIPIELDWNNGEFFETEGRYLICSTHGAIYAPETGVVLAAPAVAGACAQ